MRILILVPDLSSPGGVSAFFDSLKGHFKQHETVYFTRGSRAQVGYFWQGFIKLFDYIRFVYLLSTKSFDLIHVNTSLGTKNLLRDPWFVLIAKMFSKKVVVFFHGWKPECVTAKNRWLLNLMLKSDGIIVLAREFQDLLKEWNYKGSTFIERTVVSKELENLLDEVDTRVLSGVLNILFLSRIEVPKGIYESVQAFQKFQVATEIPVRMTIAGDGSELEKVREYISREGIQNVRFVGYVSGVDKAKELKEADIYLLPSYSEGMPISVLEAMLAGMAVVTRSTGGLVDFFDESMGRITSSKDPEVIANMLISLISNPGTLSEISAFNRNYAKHNFTVDPFIRRLEAIYSKI